MTFEKVLLLLTLMGAASYFQTVTGFGLGMIVMGAASGMNLAPVASVAALVSLVSLANSAAALPGKLHHIDWRAVGADTWMQAALAVPVVALATIAARHYPPPLSAVATRRVAFGVLVVVGCSLILSSLHQLSQWGRAGSATDAGLPAHGNPFDELGE